MYDLLREETVLDSGQASTTLRCYDINLQLTDIYEYGFASEGSAPADPTCTHTTGLAGGPLRRHTQTLYHNFLGGSPSTHILNEPDSVIVTDGSGNPVKQTTYEYTSCPTPNASNAIDLVPPATLHGDLCSNSRWVNNTGSWVTTSYSYYDTGHLYTSTDGCGNTTCGDMPSVTDHTTTYFYADSFAGGTGTPPGQTNGYLTKITHPNTGVAHIENFTWGYADGQIRTSVNQNSQTTNYVYNTPPSGCSFPDGLNRISEIDDPDGGKTAFCYNDAPYNPSTPSPSVTTTQSITSSLFKTTVTAMDGLGHTHQTQLTSDPQGTVFTDTTYDGFGRVWKQSNPHRTASSPTDGTTTTYYDGIGRSCLVVPPGGTLPSTYSCATQPANTVLTTYFGTKTTVSDQTSRQRRSFTDSLGRLIEVDEPGNGQHDAGYYTAGTGSISISGSEQSYTFYVVCGPNGQTCPQTVYDGGTISASINGEGYSAYWGQGDTSSTMAAKLAGAINAGSYAIATSGSGGVSITARTNGTGPTNYALWVSYADNNYYPQYFSHPSFTASGSGSTLTGSAAGGASQGSGSLSLSTPATTAYTYDALNNLLTVFQSARQRTFTYDSLSRMLTSSNPETATITYDYDANSNVYHKTDARNITLIYNYDGLNRTLSETYSNLDPTISYAYDQSACLGLSACQNIGRRTSMTDAAGSESWAYNDLSGTGWQTADKRTTSSITKTTTTQVNFDGSLAQIAYPTGRVVNYTSDPAGRPSTATDSANGMTYAKGTCGSGSGICYAPPGEVTTATIDVTSTFTGINLTNTYNSRLQPNELKASSTSGFAFDLSYNFVDPTTQGNNGNVWGLVNNLDTSRSQIFSYDPLNRIVTAGTTLKSGSKCWGYLFSYDIWANLTSQAGDTTNYPGCSETVMAPVTADTHNHISPFSYDASGNALSDGTYTYAWDAQSQLKSGGGVNYSYDGDGQRVSKVGSKLYWYGPVGTIIAETDSSGSNPVEYVFFGGKRVAMLPAASTPQFYVEDMLGSSRVVTSNTGVVCYDADFTPFGGERAITNSCTQNNYKFEGKERDSETQNDEFGARYYSWRFGRWLSADWSTIPVAVPYANLTNPQTLNLYAMVADNPESFADLDGHQSPGNSGSCTAADYETCTSSSTKQESRWGGCSSYGDNCPDTSGHPGLTGLLQDWFDVVEVSGSYGVGLSVQGQAGVVEGRAGAGEETEGTIGLGGGNAEVEVFGGAKATGKVGPLTGEVKAGITASSKEGVTASVEAKGAVGPAGGNVKLDKTGVHTSVGAEKNSDVKVGAHLQVGVGVGVKVNLSQAARAASNTQKAVGAAMTAIGDTLRDFGVPFNGSPAPSFRPSLN